MVEHPYSDIECKNGQLLEPHTLWDFLIVLHLKGARGIKNQSILSDHVFLSDEENYVKRLDDRPSLEGKCIFLAFGVNLW